MKQTLQHFLVCIGLLITPLTSKAQCDAPITSMFSTNGLVNASIFDPVNNVYYIGGDFTAVNTFYTQGALVNNTSGAADRNYPVVAGLGTSVLASVSDGAGGFYIGGTFTTVGGLARNRLAHINSSGQVTAWNPNADNSVNTIAISGSTIYVGGAFANVGGQARNFVAAIDATTGVATSWNPNANNSINVLVVSGSTVYTGGLFTTIGGQSRNNIAALDVTTGLATAWNPNADFLISAMAISGSNVYVGGTFTNIGGQARARIAALDMITGLATAWNPAASAQVNVIMVNGTTVYAGGAFTTIGGQSRNRIAGLDITTGLATAWNPNASSTVRALAMNGTNVLCGGDFLTIGGQTRNRIAEIDAAGLATSWNPNANSSVFTLTKDGANTYVGGAFATIGGVARNRVAALDATTGVATSWNPDINNSVYALALSGTTVYVGGLFTTVGGTARNRIAAVNSTTGVASSWDPNASGSVNAIAVSGSTVYAGGAFTTIGGQTRTRLAALDATTGLATAWDPSAGNTVKTIAVSGSSVYIGGLFTSAGGQARNRIAEIDATTGLATTWNPAASAVVNTLLVNAGTVYVGGAFSTIGGQSRLRIAAISTATGLASAWNPSADALVYGLGVSGSTLYVSGAFTTIGGQARNSVAGLNISDGLATSWNPNVAITVYTLTVGTPSIYIGGDFASVGGNTSNRNSAAFSFGGITISSHPANAAICAGANTSFSITASGVTSYQWEVSTDNGATWSNATGGIYSNSTTATLTLTNATVTYNNYQYRCVVSGGSCASGTPSSAAILTINSTPTITGTTPASRCGTGTLSLGATASGGTINWYSALTGGASIGTGASYTTPSISSTTTYYVDATNAGCTSSPRTAVVATVNSMPTITGTTPASRCGTGTLTLGAAASAGTISWYDALTAGTLLGTGTSYTTPSISSTTTYYVEVTNAGCTSSPRTAVVATVNPTPTITGTTPASRCGTGTLTLEATASAGTINWYSAVTGGASLGTGTSFTTPSISSTTTYYVDATNAGCTSSPRTAVIATVNTTPTITGTTPATRCDAGTLVLSATASTGTINWYDAITAGTLLGTGASYTTPSISSTTTYYIEVTNAGCTSSPRTAVVATVNITPTITGTTPASRCGVGTVALGAATSAGTINWYDAPTGGTLVGTGTSYTTPSIGSTTTYYVEATNAGCTSSPRIAVIATVNNTATITGTTPDSRCDAGTLTLGATASAGTINWYDAPTGGTLVGTGTSFTTPSISSTTTYYVDVTDAGCTSARTAVVATVTLTPSVIGTTPASICDAGTVSLAATTSGGTISWYDALTGGLLVGTGTSFTTPSISSTTSYFVEVSNAGCTATPRVEVIATVGTTPTITGTTPASRCGTGTLSLGATASAGTINWYSALTAGTLLGSGPAFTTPSISATTTYYVSTSDGGCTSTPRLAVVATVTSIPLRPTNTTPAANLTICSGTSTTLTVSGVGTIGWYDSALGGTYLGGGNTYTTPVLFANTTFYAQDSTCAASTLRRAILVSTTDIIAPVFTAVSNITQSADAGQCSAIVTFAAPAASDNCTSVTITSNHVSGEIYSVGTTMVFDTARDASGNTTIRSFSITVNDNELPSITCPSDVSTSLAPETCVLSGLVLSSPSTTDNCGIGSVTNNAPSTYPVGTTIVKWYVTDIHNNIDSCSQNVVVTGAPSAPPAPTNTTPVANLTICSGNTTTLTVSGVGTISWYTASTGGTYLASGVSYTTPVLSTSTTYFVQDSNCLASPRIAITVNINTTPTILFTLPSNRCDAGTVSLEASASAGTINWYDALTGGILVGTGTTFTTPSISSTTTYFVDVVNNGCTSSPRQSVVATIYNTPTITSATPATRCGSGSVTLGATTSAGVINWYDALTGGNLVGTGTSLTTSISSTTTYYVDATVATCSSSPRVAIIATVNPIPTITSTSPASVCDAGSVTLNATASAGTINWFSALTGGTSIAAGTSYTTPSISVTTTYYVAATSLGCTSSPRTGVTVTVNTTPTITGTTPASRCDAGTLSLGATASTGTINWYDALSGGNLVGTGVSFSTPSISTTTSYFLEVTNFGCTSSPRTEIIATVNATPTITGTTPASRCDAGTLTLIASTSAGTISWYDALTGGNLVGTGTSFTTPNLSATTSYFVESTDNACTSSPRIEVIATVNTTPTITGTTPATRCDAGILTLGAIASAGTISWYDALTAGTLVGSGPSFTTPSLSTSTTYFVEVSNAGCSSSPRIAVLAGVTIIDNTVTAGTSSLTSNQVGASYQWLNCSTGNSVIAGATSQTYSPTVSGTYAVMIGLNSCIDTSVCTAIVIIGVEEYVNSSLLIYPNPTSGKVYVTSAPKGEYKVINELGQSVHAFTLESDGDIEFSLESFNNGVYYLIGIQNNKIIRNKIIIAK
jgi:hypothetical protein